MRWPWSRKQVEFHDTPVSDVISQRSVASLLVGSNRRVSRTEALSIPAVQKGRNMICSIATLPLHELDLDNIVHRSPLLEQLDPDVPNVVTLAQTLEDLLFDSIGWWLITQSNSLTYPTSVRRLDPSQVSVVPPEGRSQSPLPSGIDPRNDGIVWVDGVPTPGTQVIRFDSPNPGVLTVASRSIQRAILLDQAANMYADDPRPLDYFTPGEGADPTTDDDVEVLLGQWKAARKARSTAYVPAALKYNSVETPSPSDLQLVELQKQVGLDIANAIGVDPEDLGISTTSRTYQNAVDRRQDRINTVLAPYMRAITDRLSMGDVTVRGHRVAFDLDDYLKPNPTERWNIHEQALRMNATTVEEIRKKEDMTPLPADEVPEASTQPAEPMDAVEASRTTTSCTFDGPTTSFVDLELVTFAVDAGNRIIEGLALPYNSVGKNLGMKFRFERGSLQWDTENPGKVKLLRDHDFKQPLGKAIQLRDTPKGLLARFKVARGLAGDEALELAEDGVLDGLSVGVDFDPATDTVPDPRNKGVLLVRRADLRETSLTPMPSFNDARVTTVAASRTQGGQMPEATEPTNSAPDINDVPSVPTGPQVPAVTPGMFTADQVIEMISNLKGVPIVDPEPEKTFAGRPVVNPNRGPAITHVAEASPYRFGRTPFDIHPGTHDFSSDLWAVDKLGDVAAHDRLIAFMRAAFDIQTTDVNELSPDIQRPDLYVDQLEFLYPLWNAINKGTLSDNTPFVVPKFSSSSGLVGDHTETQEPSTGSFETTSQTITPTALSGKASITRETWDRGGNPQVSGLVWRQIVREWYEELEAAAATFLGTLTAATDIALGSNTHVALDAAWTAAQAGLQFVRGGHRFDYFAVNGSLYSRFAAATGTDGRHLFPMINPQNAIGTVTSRFRTIDLGGVVGIPTWSLGATGTNSWQFNPEDVSGWASAPQRLDFNTRVAYVDIGVWGYKAFANTRIDGVRQVTNTA